MRPSRWSKARNVNDDDALLELIEELRFGLIRTLKTSVTIVRLLLAIVSLEIWLLLSSGLDMPEN